MREHGRGGERQKSSRCEDQKKYSAGQTINPWHTFEIFDQNFQFRSWVTPFNTPELVNVLRHDIDVTPDALSRV